MRAENQILKRQLKYFEDLFAQKTTVPQAFSANVCTAPTSDSSHKDQEAQDPETEVSFVLERTQSNSPGGMLALAGLVVVMCVCCIGSLSSAGVEQITGRPVG